MNLLSILDRNENASMKYTCVMLVFIFFNLNFPCNSIVSFLWFLLKLLKLKVYGMLNFPIHLLLLSQQSCIAQCSTIACHDNK